MTKPSVQPIRVYTGVPERADRMHRKESGPMERSLRGSRTAFAVTTIVLLLATACTPGDGGGESAGASGGGGGGGTYHIGVSNTLTNNGWREEMICSINAQAVKSGEVADLTVIHRDTDAAGQ